MGFALKSCLLIHAGSAAVEDDRNYQWEWRTMPSMGLSKCNVNILYECTNVFRLVVPSVMLHKNIISFF